MGKACAAALLAATVLFACARHEAPAGPCPAVSDGAVSVVDPWVREQPAIGGTTAAYFTLCNASEAAAALVRVETQAAATAEIHETRRNDEGVVSMARLSELVANPGGLAQLEPGGAHVMLFGVTGPLVAGEAVPMTLAFSDGSTLVVVAEVRAAKAAADAGHAGH